MLKSALLALFLITGLCPAASAEVLYVDRFSPICFTSIDDAIDAAQDGDVILVSPALYPSFTLDGKGVSIVALQAGLERVSLQSATIRNVPAGSSAYLQGLRITDHVLVADSSGTVTLNQFDVVPNVQDLPYLRVVNCQDARVHNSFFECQTAFNSAVVGVRVINSRAELVNCEVRGAAENFTSFFAALIGMGIDADSRVHLSLSRISGGDVFNIDAGCGVQCSGELVLSGSPSNSFIRGGNIPLPVVIDYDKPFDGGDALVLGDSSGSRAFARLSGAALIPGKMFANTGAVTQYQLYGIDGSGPFGKGRPGLPLKLISGSYETAAPIDPSIGFTNGSETELNIYGDPGGQVTLELGQAPTLNGTVGTYLEELIQPQQSFDLGALPSAGVLTVDLNSLTSLDIEGTHWLQAQVTYDGTDVRRSNSASLFLEIQENDCNQNGVEDTCEFDCNQNGLPDACDFAQGTSVDLNGNTVPDECETIVYVSRDATGLNDGSSWANAFVELRSAMDDHSTGKTIWVAKGRYFPDFVPKLGVQTGNRAESFVLRKAVRLLGGFAGDETSEDQRDPAQNPTILSGDIGTPGNALDDSYHILVGNDISSEALVDGFILVAGNANGPAEKRHNQGGAVRFEQTKVHLNDCTFLQNQGQFGGALYAFLGFPVLSNCTVLGANATDGGALYFTFSTPKLSNIEVRNCTASEGAALFTDSSVEVFNGLFADNQAPDGSIACRGGAVLELINCAVLNNTNALRGREACNINLRNSIVWGNTGFTYFAQGDSNITLTFTHSQAMAPTMGTAALVQDPLISRVSNGSYQLLDSSPCIDSGKLSFISEDFGDLDGDGDLLEETPFDLAGNVRRIDSLDVPDTGAGPAPDVDRGPFERNSP